MDTGLLCHFYNIKSKEDFFQSPARGAIWETFVCSELRKYQQWQQGRPQLWMFRTLSQLEVDFMIQKGGRFHLIEAKLKETGKYYLKGKDYVVEDGDILSILHSS